MTVLRQFIQSSVLLLLSYAGSPSRVFRPLHLIIICRVKSGITNHHPASSTGLHVTHRLSLTIGPNLLDAISFYSVAFGSADAIQQRPLLSRKVEARLSDCGFLQLSAVDSRQQTWSIVLPARSWYSSSSLP